MQYYTIICTNYQVNPYIICTFIWFFKRVICTFMFSLSFKTGKQTSNNPCRKCINAWLVPLENHPFKERNGIEQEELPESIKNGVTPFYEVTPYFLKYSLTIPRLIPWTFSSNFIKAILAIKNLNFMFVSIPHR